MTTSVVAVCDLAEGILSLPGVGPIDLKRLLTNTTPTMTLHVDICEKFMYITEEQVEKEWARYISVAKNCHEQNIEIANSSQGYILRTIRRIKIGEELYVWFGADLLTKLEFPFLNPCNIKSNKAYRCHKCGSTFEDPNPLKVHLSFCCKNLLKVFPLEQTCHYDTAELFPYNSMRYTELKPPITDKKLILVDEKLPYVHPFLCNMIPSTDDETKPSRCFNSVEIPVPNTSAKQLVLQQSTVELSPASSTWKSKREKYSHSSQGHICGFCGKIYSRKYGLKIHVRTHTGYKPLKCKYCYRPFSDPSNLNKHVRLHSDSDAPYRCLKCGKVLVRRRDLERHINSRHPETAQELIK